MRKLLLHAACLSLIALLPAEVAYGQSTYEITIDLDDATLADDELFDAALLAAPIGAAPQNLRKLVAGINGEVQVLLSQRIDENGFLTLDDGTLVALSGGDILMAKKARKKHVSVVHIVFRLREAHLPGEGGSPYNGMPRISNLTVNNGTVCRQMSFEGGQPTIFACKF